MRFLKWSDINREKQWQCPNTERGGNGELMFRERRVSVWGNKIIWLKYHMIYLLLLSCTFFLNGRNNHIMSVSTSFYLIWYMQCQFYHLEPWLRRKLCSCVREDATTAEEPTEMLHWARWLHSPLEGVRTVAYPGARKDSASSLPQIKRGKVPDPKQTQWLIQKDSTDYHEHSGKSLENFQAESLYQQEDLRKVATFSKFQVLTSQMLHLFWNSPSFPSWGIQSKYWPDKHTPGLCCSWHHQNEFFFLIFHTHPWKPTERWYDMEQ